MDSEQLPESEEVLGILRQERSQLNTWVNIAVSECDWIIILFLLLILYKCIHTFLQHFTYGLIWYKINKLQTIILFKEICKNVKLYSNFNNILTFLCKKYKFVGS